MQSLEYLIKPIVVEVDRKTKRPDRNRGPGLSDNSHDFGNYGFESKEAIKEWLETHKD